MPDSGTNDIGWPWYASTLAMGAGGCLGGGIPYLILGLLLPDPIRLWAGIVFIALGVVLAGWYMATTSRKVRRRRMARR